MSYSIITEDNNMPLPTLLSVNEWRKKSSDEIAAGLLRNVYDATTIYDRFDKLIELYEHCREKSGPEYENLSQALLSIIGHIINDDDPASIKGKIEARKNIKAYDSYYMPWPHPEIEGIDDPLDIYNVHKDSAEELSSAFKIRSQKLKDNKDQQLLKNHAHGEEFQGYRSSAPEERYSGEELEAFRVIPYQFKLLKLNVSNKGDNRKLSFTYADTEKLSIKAGDESYPETYEKKGIYTIHVNGSFFIGESLASGRRSFIAKMLDEAAILHPSYSDPSGLPLFMAGQTQVFSGDSHMIDGASGHFLPDQEQTERAMNYLRRIGTVNNHTLLAYYTPEGKYTEHKMTEADALATDYIVANQLDPRTLTTKWLKKKVPAYNLQLSINNEMRQWQKESWVFLSTPSAQTLSLNESVEHFSKFARHNEPEKTLQLLEDIQQKIRDWKKYHADTGISSRRAEAVNKLEARVKEQIQYYSTYLRIQQYVDEHGEDTSPTFFNDFLKYKIDLEKLREETESQISHKSGFFASAHETEIPEDLHSLYHEIKKRDVKLSEEPSESLGFKSEIK
ncbi:hypothetical protein E3983_03165 [Legionella israelensis]|uniref:Coiled-coil protein n=1 Tax=Legionella israelensis TaxID=454 RepID=A0AAX1EEB9_9GAMM|nr:hypothetical protein [Legionella israelensis]QBR83448.1 hypothetical protein E3983_03165 [Legionella israelensis]